MAQNGSQNRSQNRSQNGPQNKSQSGPQNKAHNKPLIETPVLDKWTGSVELISGLGISHLSNDADDSDPYTHLLEQVKLILSRATSTFSFNTEAQGFFEKNETFTQRTTMRGQSRTEILSRKSEFIRPGSSLHSDFTVDAERDGAGR